MHSYAVGTTLIDPLLGPDGLDALPGPVSQILLTNRHHYRSSGEIAERFGCPVRCHQAGLHEFAGTDRVVEGFAWGDRLAGDVVAVKLDAICDEETVLHVAAGDGALAFADGLVEWEGQLGFVPDFLLGDDAAGRQGAPARGAVRAAGSRVRHAPARPRRAGGGRRQGRAAPVPRRLTAPACAASGRLTAPALRRSWPADRTRASGPGQSLCGQRPCLLRSDPRAR